MKEKGQKIIKILTLLYLIPFAVMIVFNTVNSLLRTTYFDLYQVMETAKYKWDNPFILLIASAGVIICFYFLMRTKWMKKIPIERLALVYSAVLCLFIVLLFRCVATCDSSLISDIAIEFLQKNYQAFEQGEYLYRYSFQIGFTALLELIYQIFGVENFIVFQLINILCIVVILKMLGKITRELFEEESVDGIEAVLSMGMLPLFLFSTFVYGDIIGWSFGVSGIYFIIRYLKTDKWQEPVFITKNGYGDLVVMSMETYESMLETAETDAAILEAETEYAQSGKLHDARSAFDSLRRKHFG